MNELVPASYTGSRSVRVSPVSEGNNRLRTILVRALPSVFGSLGLTMP